MPSSPTIRCPPYRSRNREISCRPVRRSPSGRLSRFAVGESAFPIRRPGTIKVQPSGLRRNSHGLLVQRPGYPTIRTRKRLVQSGARLPFSSLGIKIATDAPNPSCLPTYKPHMRQVSSPLMGEDKGEGGFSHFVISDKKTGSPIKNSLSLTFLIEDRGRIQGRFFLVRS